MSDGFSGLKLHLRKGHVTSQYNRKFLSSTETMKYKKKKSIHFHFLITRESC